MQSKTTSLESEIEKYRLIREIVKYSQKLDQKGFGANHDGNISVKHEDVLLATPTAVSKGNITAEMIIVLDAKGNKLDGLGKPFSEIKLHIAAYAARPDCKAVVHAHPPFAMARGLVNLPLKPNLPEAVVSLGAIVPVAPFSMPGTAENENVVQQMLSEVDVLMMAGNGVLAVGDSVEQAYLRLELVEHLAKVDYYAHMMGKPIELSQENIYTLLEKRAAAGLGPKVKVISDQASSFNLSSSLKSCPDTDIIKTLIAEEIKNLLR